MKYSRKKYNAHFAIIIITVSVGFLGCNSDGNTEYPTEQHSITTDSVRDIAMQDSMADAVKIGVNEEQRFGTYLTDGSGRPLYLFTADMQGESSACYDNCAEAWPPFLTKSDPVATVSAVKDGLLGTIVRQDSSRQVTYNGWPLYYYRKDIQEGRITGQDVQSFGGEWYLVTPEGEKVHAEE